MGRHVRERVDPNVPGPHASLRDVGALFCAAISRALEIVGVRRDSAEVRYPLEANALSLVKNIIKENSVPLRDHFRAPLDDVHSWDELYGGWPMMIVQKLIEVLPELYFAAPGVHLGTLYEVDIGTYRRRLTEANDFDVANGGVSVSTYAPPKRTLTLEPQLPNQDVYEVRIYDSRRNRHLVAAIEIVSPPNKDRAENRTTFVAKAATLLKNNK